MPHTDRVLAAVDAATDEIVDFTRELIRMPTVNPPGDGYAECAETIGRRLSACGFETQLFPAEGLPEHTRRTRASTSSGTAAAEWRGRSCI